MIGAYALFWLALMVLGIVNGVVREMTYGRRVAELWAHQLSTLLLSLLCGGAVWLFERFVPIDSIRGALTVGGLWLGLTVVFEFGFGRYVAGHPWSRLLADYNLAAGRVWLVFLLWLTLLPAVVYGLH